MSQKEMRLAFTGHRPGKYFGYGFDDAHRARIRSLIYSWLTQWVQRGEVVTCITGGALGFDQDALAAALEVKGVRNIVAVPFEGQEVRWNQEDQRRYADLLRRAHRVELVSPPGYAAWKMHARNEWMVNRCTNLIALYDNSPTGGTAACMRYAAKQGKPRVIINPVDLSFKVIE